MAWLGSAKVGRYLAVVMVTRLEPPPNAVMPDRPLDAPAPGTRLPAHYLRCFGCGDGEPTGLHLRMFAGEGLTVAGTFEVTEHHQGAPGLAHGGLLTCAFDETFGMLGHITRRSQVTARLETDFRRPVAVGAVLYITAKVDGVAGRETYMSAVGRLDTETGRVAVRARAMFVAVEISHFTVNGRADDIDAVRQNPQMISTASYTVNP